MYACCRDTRSTRSHSSRRNSRSRTEKEKKQSVIRTFFEASGFIFVVICLLAMTTIRRADVPNVGRRDAVSVGMEGLEECCVFDPPYAMFPSMRNGLEWSNFNDLD